jgi:hypothetical protein
MHIHSTRSGSNHQVQSRYVSSIFLPPLPHPLSPSSTLKLSSLHLKRSILVGDIQMDVDNRR